MRDGGMDEGMRDGGGRKEGRKDGGMKEGGRKGGGRKLLYVSFINITESYKLTNL